jgi:hypothetical protein
MATTSPTAATSRAEGAARVWSGWTGFAALAVLVLAGITALEGLIAIVRDKYFVVVGNQVIVFDLTTWGWIMLIWGALLALAGFALASGRGWARWFTIVLASLNVIGQLGFLGNTQYPLWTLAAIAFDTLILYALTVRWESPA